MRAKERRAEERSAEMLEELGELQVLLEDQILRLPLTDATKRVSAHRSVTVVPTPRAFRVSVRVILDDWNDHQWRSDPEWEYGLLLQLEEEMVRLGYHTQHVTVEWRTIALDVTPHTDPKS